MTYDSVVQELDGLIDSLDEHVTIEDVGVALGELRANVFERAKAEKAHTPTDDERETLYREAVSRAEDRYPALNDDDEVLSYPRAALRQHMRGAYLDGFTDGALRRPVQGEPTDAQVEAAAEVIAVANDDGPWADLLDTLQDEYRRDARAALRAAAAVTTEPSAARLLAQGFSEGVKFVDDQPGPWGAGMVAGRAEAARRLAATEQGDNR